MAFYFNQYIQNMIYDTEYAYTLLDEEYKEKRFGDYNKFNEYVKTDLNNIEKSIIVKYKIEEFDDYKEYICKDNYNNYYIFKETEPTKYTVMLDQYTIQDKIFMDKYNEQKDNIKAQMNLNLFNQMLNRKDYNSAYNFLNEDFRKKYFETEESFEKYIKENLFEFSEFNYNNCVYENEKYKIKTEIKNLANSNNDDNVVKRFGVELSGKAFYISFDI